MTGKQGCTKPAIWCWLHNRLSNCRLQSTAELSNRRRVQKTYSPLQLEISNFWMHFIEAKHEEHVINILCISRLPLQSFCWLAFVQHRDEADLSSILLKKKPDQTARLFTNFNTICSTVLLCCCFTSLQDLQNRPTLARLFLLSLIKPQPHDHVLVFQGSMKLTMATSESRLSIPHICSLPHASLSCRF